MSIGALIDKFRAVALDRIERMNLSLVQLERDPSDAQASEEILREIHTLKGEAKMMGFADINLVAHQTENLLMAAHQVDWRIESSGADAIFGGFDLIRTLLTKKAGSNDDPVDLSLFVDGVQHILREMVPGSHEEGGDSSSEQTSLDGEGDGPDAPPSGEGTRNKDPRIPGGSGASGSAGALTTEPAASALRLQAENTLRVRFDKLERLGDVASEVMLMSRRMDHHLSELMKWRNQLREWTKMTEPNLPKSHVSALRHLRHRFDALATEAIDDNHLVEVRTTQLDDEVRTLRHIPLAQVISHYPRAVRDLAQSQHKRVRFIHDVGNLEVDRAVLSALSDPLLHLVRNAVDHGIESPEEREAQGKDAEAVVKLEVEHVGDSLCVTLSDDGRGIDSEFILKRALERGVISEKKAKDLDAQHLLALIFEPGFSTKDEVTDVSGRGIGMDIVLRHITTLGGVVEVESKVGEGTRFTLLVPLSSAVIEILVIALGGSHVLCPSQGHRKDREGEGARPRRDSWQLECAP